MVGEEMRLLEGSAAVTIVSRSWGESLDRRFGVGSKLHVISNGYDPEELAAVEPHDFGHFAIVYAGNFYPPKRVATPLMAMLKCLKETAKGVGAEWFFHYYGRHENHVIEEAKRFGVRDKVISHGWVPQSEAWSAIGGAGFVTVISSVSNDAAAEDMGIMTGKLYEALGLRAPVLLIAPQESDLARVAESTLSVKIFTGSCIEEMALYARDLMSRQNPNLKTQEEFAWPTIAKDLDGILRRAIGANGAPIHRLEYSVNQKC
jgi:glycosyltransferase involved in cell wall biosynthesis